MNNNFVEITLIIIFQSPLEPLVKVKLSTGQASKE